MAQTKTQVVDGALPSAFTADLHTSPPSATISGTSTSTRCTISSQIPGRSPHGNVLGRQAEHLGSRTLSPTPRTLGSRVVVGWPAQRTCREKRSGCAPESQEEHQAGPEPEGEVGLECPPLNSGLLLRLLLLQADHPLAETLLLRVLHEAAVSRGRLSFRAPRRRVSIGLLRRRLLALLPLRFHVALQ